MGDDEHESPFSSKVSILRQMASDNWRKYRCSSCDVAGIMVQIRYSIRKKNRFSSSGTDEIVDSTLGRFIFGTVFNKSYSECVVLLAKIIECTISIQFLDFGDGVSVPGYSWLPISFELYNS